jgi:hypothetical protein
MEGVSVNEINNKYAVASREENLILEKVKRKWVKDIEIEESIMVSSNEDIWYLEEINLMITKYGSKPFEELNLYKSEYINNILK